MKSTNELVKELKQRGELIIDERNKDMLPDLTFTLDCMCITYKKREVETTKRGRVVRIKLTSIH
ncbi:hypothetical protein pEaSNUABM40_00318 [Erwinia phage pEa_SNUABM_40]|uniref:Uncharacterized protein n=1 Tax=Erwinia phage pEa_SNUABM_3 TaxID=2869552 RepID=A0AAE7XLH9_9CAUD|nr:hypothetical protein MPK68_gp316 [Erwinia phage pEa_SNUABM_3]QZE56850.1 hypothetical protein pEaSNUABM20_00314 [Erwinia phage pEa_SNUABM_20]QZE58534.1 hypothetical protein pEaSNUABM40_00318 [Erwinia phage pEa_SNUABM_40]UAW53095.1 hypothetical protein pEaSNUABM23_00313 [Erwinia phage pEa_SNUABM_23]UIW10990.1 hypothetical protein pEaSNUABM23_00313 [Erwinia phage pEa_SNUABM_31]QZE56513.1 hypothetical protein pEaSNUABM3_00316 [Erwinia phage pEa_SNUABM_3]